MIILPPLPPAPPAIIRVQQSVAPNAGAPGQADAAASSVPPGKTATRSDNGGNLASPKVPGGRNRAPVQGPKNGSFSAPIQK